MLEVRGYAVPIDGEAAPFRAELRTHLDQVAGVTQDVWWSCEHQHDTEDEALQCGHDYLKAKLT